MITLSTRYHIFERSESGKLRIPMYRPAYDYEDRRRFNICGYESEAQAIDAIESHIINNTCGQTYNFFILPEIIFEHTPRIQTNVY